MSWQITFDHISSPEDGPSRVGLRDDVSRVSAHAAILGFRSEPLPKPAETVPFRLKDDDGEVYYEGWLHDDDECLNQTAALDYGIADAGCTTIEVRRDGSWVQEIA